MQAHSRVETIARLLIEAHRRGQPIDATGAPPASMREAYLIQDLVADALWRDAAITAWKTGGSGAAPPIAAPIAPRMVYTSPATVPSRSFHVIGIEAELAYRLKADLPPIGRAYDEGDLAAAIDSVHAAIELCDSRLREWRVADPMWKLADNQLNAGLVVGSGLGDWQTIVPSDVGVTIEVNGKTVTEAVGSHPLGDPFALLPFLANHCAARRGGLRAGDIVTTGSWTGMIFVERGADVVARFAGIGEARAHFIL